MTPIELNAVVNNLNTRVDHVEQILPTLATKPELLAVKQDVLATQRDVLAVKEDVLAVKKDVLAVKADVLAVKQDVLAVKADVVALKQDVLVVKQDVLATRDALMTAIAELRGQMLMLHEDNKSDNRLLAEHLAGVMHRLDRLEQRSVPPPA
jgi:hypothetical protein